MKRVRHKGSKVTKGLKLHPRLKGLGVTLEELQRRGLTPLPHEGPKFRPKPGRPRKIPKPEFEQVIRTREQQPLRGKRHGKFKVRGIRRVGERAPSPRTPLKRKYCFDEGMPSCRYCIEALPLEIQEKGEWLSHPDIIGSWRVTRGKEEVVEGTFPHAHVVRYKVRRDAQAEAERRVKDCVELSERGLLPTTSPRGRYIPEGPKVPKKGKKELALTVAPTVKLSGLKKKGPKRMFNFYDGPFTWG